MPARMVFTVGGRAVLLFAVVLLAAAVGVGGHAALVRPTPLSDAGTRDFRVEAPGCGGSIKNPAECGVVRVLTGTNSVAATFPPPGVRADPYGFGAVNASRLLDRSDRFLLTSHWVSPWYPHYIGAWRPDGQQLNLAHPGVWHPGAVTRAVILGGEDPLFVGVGVNNSLAHLPSAFAFRIGAEGGEAPPFSGRLPRAAGVVWYSLLPHREGVATELEVLPGRLVAVTMGPSRIVLSADTGLGNGAEPIGVEVLDAFEVAARWRRAGRFDRAADTLIGAAGSLPAGPTRAAAFWMAANAQWAADELSRRDHDQAAELYQRSVAEPSAPLDAYLDLGALTTARGEVTEGAALVDRAAVAGSRSSATFVLFYCLLVGGDATEAEALRRDITTSPWRELAGFESALARRERDEAEGWLQSLAAAGVGDVDGQVLQLRLDLARGASHRTLRARARELLETGGGWDLRLRPSSPGARDLLQLVGEEDAGSRGG